MRPNGAKMCHYGAKFVPNDAKVVHSLTQINTN